MSGPRRLEPAAEGAEDLLEDPLDDLLEDLADGADARLAGVDAALAADEAARARAAARGPEPVHVCYVPADRVSATTALEWGEAAVAALDVHGADADELAAVLGVDRALVDAVLPRVRAALARRPVADLRADLEDGYGRRDDAVEDTDAAAAGTAVADLLAADRAPARAGARVKSMEAATRRRGLRSWALFLAGYLDAGGDPARLRVTLPKVSAPEQVEAFAAACAALEEHHGIGPVALELQVETARAVVSVSGTATVAAMVAAAGERAAGLHYGTYDYSAALGVAPDQQRADHPAAEHAKAVMAVVGAGAGVPVSDGSSAVLPVGDHAAVLEAWRVQARIVRRALELGVPQGWDMHPAQIPARLVVVHAFYRAGAPAALRRLQDYAAGAGAGVLDEPATERALTGFLRRGVACGALDAREAGTFA